MRKRYLCAATAAVLTLSLGLLPARAADPITVITNDFESATTQGWTPRGSDLVEVSTAAAHGGSHSLLSTGRAASWEGPVLDLLTTVEAGTRYTFSAWVRMVSGSAQLRMSVERRWQGTPSYDQVAGNTDVTGSGWVQLTGSYTLANDADFLSVYVESAGATGDFYLDDFTLSYVPPTPIQDDIPSLKEVFADDFPIGAAIGRAEILGEHGRLLAKHFNSVTPGNSLKWDATEPSEGSFSFTDADALVDFAKHNNQAIRGHTLVWHQQTPAWVFNDAGGQPMTPTADNKALLLSRLDSHIRAVAGRYSGDISAWDVVNEVIDENQADGLRRSRWFEIAGLDYIRTAFRVAREVAPSAKLFINDYNTNVPSKRDKLFQLVSQLRSDGVPIDGVGHQMHGNVDWPSASETDAMLQKFVPLGVEQQITEMDISIYTNSGESFPTPPADRLARQAERYRALFDVYRQHRAHITSVTLWGLADDNTWLDTFPVTRKDAPLLFDTQLQAKSAYWAIAGTPSPTPTQSGGCRVAYTVNTWTSAPGQGGFTASLTVTNRGQDPIDGWTLRFAFGAGQTVTQGWSANWTQSGANVAATNMSWNAVIPPDQSVQIGFNGTWAGSNPNPDAFWVNNMRC